MRGLLSAFQFLTRLPIPGKGDLSGSVPYFPVVGLAIGAVAAGADALVGRALAPLPTSVVTVLVLLGASGFLHLDGLADTADGFLSSRPRERILEIMRDSRVGPMGVMAIVAVLLLKVSLLASATGPSRLYAVLLAPVAGRCALVITMAALPYAREQGLCSAFSASKWAALWAVAFLLGAGYLTGLLWAAVASIAATLLVAGYSHLKIRGMTGDTLGATCELVEIVPLLVAALHV
ncbi:MAG: adenosylcobinamide-GDP ribazoletransferase [Armatimonadota bacterium]